MKKQIELLKKHGITNYVIKDGVLTINGLLVFNTLTSVDKDFLKGAVINGSLHLSLLSSVDKDFLKGTIINGSLYLDSLINVDKGFLKETIINGSLRLNSLISADKDFLKGAIINGYLYLDSLTIADKDFLKGTIVKGSLVLYSLTNFDEDFLKKTTIKGFVFLTALASADEKTLLNNVKQLEYGYNKEKGYCFFDGILSKVLSVKKTNGYIIYTTHFGFIAQKDEKTAHGVSVKKAIIDLEFKFVHDKLNKEPIKEDTIITNQYYRIITGACEQGVVNWKRENGIKDEEIKAIELLPILKKTNAYGFNRFKELVEWVE